MKNFERFPRKLKKMLKIYDSERWENFLKKKKEAKEREEHLDKLFFRDYSNVWVTFRRMLRHGRQF